MTTESMTEEEMTAAKVLRQVEYYFSPGNPSRDRFLNSKIDESPEHWVDGSMRRERGHCVTCLQVNENSNFYATCGCTYPALRPRPNWSTNAAIAAGPEIP